jgi:hypothetical protein
MHTKRNLLKKDIIILSQLNVKGWNWKKKLELTRVSMSNMQPWSWGWDKLVKCQSKEYYKA